jgi:taurine transport system substrate-binding protein
MTPRILFTAVLAAAAFAAGCGDDDSGSSSSGSESSSASKAPETIVVGYQAIPNGDLVVKHEGYLEAAFPDSKIEWKQFDSGGSVNEAIAADDIDFGLAGSSPVARGLSQPLEYQVPWIHDVIGKAEALVAKEGITDVAQLKGKKIATPLASTAHYSLLAVLEKAGLQQKDVKIIDAEPPDIAAAWERGDIDAAYVWNPVLAQLKKNGTELANSEELSKEGKPTYDLAVVANSFAEEHPDAVKTWVEQQDKAVKLIESDPDKAAADVAAELNLKPEEAAAQMKDLIFLDAAGQAGPDGLPALGKALEATATFNKDLGQIPKTQDAGSYADAVKVDWAKQVAGG